MTKSILFNIIHFLPKFPSPHTLVLKEAFIRKWHLCKIFLGAGKIFKLTQKITFSVKFTKFRCDFSQSNGIDFVFE